MKKALDRCLKLCLVLLVTTTPFIFNFSTSELFEFNKMIWIYAWTVVAAVLWLNKMILAKKFLLKNTPLDLPIGLFLLSQILATIFSIHPQTSIFGYYTRFNGGILSSFTYVFLFYLITSELNGKQLKTLLVALLLSSALVAGYAIPEEFGKSFSCVLATRQWTTDCWSENTNPSNRIFGTFGQPNWLAAYLVLILPMSWYFLTRVKTIWQKWSLVALSSWLLLALIFTKSRSGWLALITASLFWLAGQVLTKKIKSSGRDLLKIGLAFMLTIGLLGTTFTPSVAEFWQKFNQRQSNSETIAQQKAEQFVDPGGTDSGDIRKIVWQGALRVAARYPIFGSGVETFAYSYYLDRPIAHNYVSEWDFLYNKAHNEFLNFLATTGVVGFASYLILLGSVYFLAFRTAKERAGLAWALSAGLSALYVSNFFGFSTVTSALLMHVFWAGIVINQRADKNEKLEKKQLTNWHWWAIGLVVVVGAIGLRYFWRIWQADRAYAASQRYYSAGKIETAIAHASKAIKLQPYQAEYYSQLSMEYSNLAMVTASADATLSAELETLAKTTSDLAIRLNPVHLNLYKNRIRVLAQLAGSDKSYITPLTETLNQAINLAPTDPRLFYSLVRVHISTDDIQSAQESFNKLKSLKSDYPDLSDLEESIASASARL